MAKYGATTWLQRRRAKKVRAASLAELAAAELTSPLQRNKLTNLVDRIGNQVAEQLAPVLAARFGSLPENEVEAAIAAVVDVLADADLSDQGFLAADADAEELARRLRGQFDGAGRALLAADAVPLYELALDLACRHLVEVVRHLPSFQSAALAEVLARLTTQTEYLEQLLVRVPTTSLRAPTGTQHDDEFRTEYLRALANKLDRLELLGLPTDEQPNLSLTVAYLTLSVSGGAGPRRERRVRPFMSTKGQTDGISVEEAIGPRTLVRGDAGSGKTTLLDWLAVKSARQELPGPLDIWNDYVPFSVRLRRFAAGELPGPEQWVKHAASMVSDLQPDGWVHRQLHENRALLLVDGVDEVPATRRRAVRTWLRELLQTFPRLHVIVTSRRAAVDKRWLDDEHFTSIELEPMSQENILAFVKRWHEAAEVSGTVHNVPGSLRRLRGQLEQPHLRELAATPLLCAMLCALNLTYRSELPRNRMELYAKALSMLLHLRDKERGIVGLLDDSGKRVVLRDLAWRLTLANRIEFDHQQALEFLAAKLPALPPESADPSELLDHLLERSGVLRKPVPGKVDFVHRTFQEYLAADEAVQQHHVPTVVAHAHLDTWRETVVMACGHATARQATDLLSGILNRAEKESNNARALRLVATACMETAQDIDPRVRTRLDAMVQDKLVPPRSRRETESLASVGYHILRHLPRDLDSLSDSQAQATTRVAALTGSPDALPLLARYASDARKGVQSEIESAWHYFDPEHYAKVVLANASLFNGEITVTSRLMIPHLRYLDKLSRTCIRLPANEAIADLTVVSNVPNLRRLELRVSRGSSVDLGPLADHGDLEFVDLTRAGKFVGARSIAKLSNLVHLALTQEAPWRGGKFLRALQGLRALHLSARGDLDFSALVHMEHLRSLSFANPGADLLHTIPLCEQVLGVGIWGTGSICLKDLISRFPRVDFIVLRGFNLNLNDLPLSPLRILEVHECAIEGLESIVSQANLQTLIIMDSPTQLDVSSLADLNLELRLSRADGHRGIEKLTSSAKVKYLE